jgi:hypothetical protein
VITIACVLALAALLAAPVHVLRAVWQASLARYLLDAAALPRPSSGASAPTSPTTPS